MEIRMQGKILDFFQRYKKLHYRKRETILFAGDIPSGTFLITNGYVRSFLILPDGREITARIYAPNDIFSFRTTFINEPVTHSYQTLTEVDVLRAPKEHFASFVTANSEILFMLTQRLLYRLNRTVTKLEITLMGSAYQKLMVNLVALAEELGESQDDIITIPIPFTHQELSTFTGLTRETVTLEIDRLRSANLIEYEGRQLKILNIKKLQEQVNLAGYA